MNVEAPASGVAARCRLQYQWRMLLSSCAQVFVHCTGSSAPSRVALPYLHFISLWGRRLMPLFPDCSLDARTVCAPTPLPLSISAEPTVVVGLPRMTTAYSSCLVQIWFIQGLLHATRGLVRGRAHHL